MQYLLLIAEPEEDVPEAVIGEILAGHRKLHEALMAAGVDYSGQRLRESHTATTVVFKDGERTLHDGPFAETRELLGGYYLVDVADLDEALKWAKMIPLLDGGKVEVRPVWTMGG